MDQGRGADGGVLLMGHNFGKQFGNSYETEHAGAGEMARHVVLAEDLGSIPSTS